MVRKKSSSWFLRSFIGVVGAAALILATHAWWLPRALPPLCGLVAVELGSVERVAGGRLRLDDIRWRGDALQLRLDRAELPSLWTYGRERLSGTWSQSSAIELGTLEVDLSSAPEATTASGEAVVPTELLGRLRSRLSQLDRWLPPLELRLATLTEEDKPLLELRDVAYGDRRASGVAALAGLEDPLTLSAELSAGAPWALRVDDQVSGVAGVFRISFDAEAARLDAEISAREARLEATANWSGPGWMPETGSLQSEPFAWENPGAAAPLPSALHKLSVRQIEGLWDGDALQLAIGGSALVVGVDEQMQDIRFDLAGRADRRGAVLQALDLEGSGLRADLSSPLAYRWEERSFAGPAHLQLAVDLGAVDWLAAEGVLQGTLTVETDDLQSVTFDLKGSGLRRDQFTLERIDLSGSASASAINLDLLSVQPSPERAEVVTLSGRIDLANEALALAVAGEIGPDWVNQIAGRDILAGPLRVADGAITGPWQEPRLGADLQAAVEVGGNSPLRVDGGLSWDGVDTAHWEGQMQLESTTVDLDVAFATAEESWMVQLDSLALSGGPWPPLRLREPARLTWLRAEGAWEDRLSVSDFDLSGGDTQIAGRFDGGEGLRLTGSHLSLGPAADWLPEVLAGLEIVELQLEAPRLGPVLEGGLSLVVEEQLPDGGALRLESELLLTPSAIELTRLGLSYPEGIVLDGAVDLPLRIVPQRGPQEAGANAAGGFWPALPSWLEATDAALQGQLSAQSNAALADWLQSRTGMRLRDAAVQLVLSGTVEDPQGALEMRIAELSTGRALGGQSLPPLQRVELRAEIDDQRARVDGFRFVVNQSRVAAEASLALAPLKVPGGSSWRSVLEASTASFQLDEWRAEDWMDWLPSALRRSGEIGGSLRLEPGLRWSGQLEATGFGLRPTPTIASVDRIGGRLQFADREIRLEDAGATVGGEPVRLRGQVDLENLSQPLWSFELEGDAVPIRRSTEMLLRSDLDLRLEASDPDVPVTLSGRLGLVSSTLLIDFDPLAPRLKRGAPTQPPFFSITQAPMADWRFDLSIEGDRFMRVRSPYLRALLSADFDLTGSFAEPILLGSVRTAEAQVFFPGAKFKINEGEASIDRSQPNELRLAFNGIARKASRVIVMDVSQTLSDPMVRLESTPPLPQAELIRFLATGSTNGGVGNLGLYLGQGMLGAGSVEEGLTDRLTIDVGEETTRSGGNTLDVGFELSPHWSVEGSYDVFDAYNTDLIWTLFRR